jgi:magnesium transporter
VGECSQASARLPRVISGRRYRGSDRPEPIDLAGSDAYRLEPGSFSWFDIVEPGRDDLEELRKAFGLHPVTVEDTMHRRQRPKVELFDAYAYVVLRPLTIAPNPPVALQEHEVHVVAGRDFIVTLRWTPEFPMDRVQARWDRHPDVHEVGFAIYALLDEVVDGYLTALEALEDEADALEDLVFEREGDAAEELQQRLFRLKRDTVVLRRSAMPLRQGIDLIQEDEALAPPALAPYFRDIMDHVIRVVELADNVRDLLTSLLEVRVAQAANRLNEAMKSMTAWAGIILVPTLIAGIYGMNFDHMPELSWQLGYPLAIGLMAGAALGLYVYFKKRGWL